MVVGARRRPGQRLHRQPAREPAADRRGRRAQLRADSLHAADQPVRNVGRGRGVADDVARDGACRGRSAPTLRARLNAGLRQISFLVVPSAAAFLAIGDVIVALLFQSGAFTHADAIYVWAVIAGSASACSPRTIGRLYNSTFYALCDTRTPLKFALVRVVAHVDARILCARFRCRSCSGSQQRWGVAGLTASAGWQPGSSSRCCVAASIGASDGPGSSARYLAKLWGMAIVGARRSRSRSKLANRRDAGPRLTALMVIPVLRRGLLGPRVRLRMPRARLDVAIDPAAVHLLARARACA